MRVNPKDLAAGAVFVVIGLAFAVNAWINLRIGRAHEMGPGYFPVVLGSILVMFGVAIALSAVGRSAETIGRASWRGVVLVTGAIVFFAATVRGLGLAPALGGATAMAALASGRMSLAASLLLSATLTAFCVVLFLYALQLPYPAIGPWLGR